MISVVDKKTTVTFAENTVGVISVGSHNAHPVHCLRLQEVVDGVGKQIGEKLDKSDIKDIPTVFGFL
jgi:hypothetical protein